MVLFLTEPYSVREEDILHEILIYAGGEEATEEMKDKTWLKLAYKTYFDVKSQLD